MRRSAAPLPKAAAPRRPSLKLDSPAVTAVSSLPTYKSSGHHFDDRGRIDDESRNLENEYITNLQQQAYFLELELNLLKKQQQSGTADAPARRLRGSSAPGSSGDNDTSSAEHLDDVMLTLKEKYVQQEINYKQRIDQLQDENDQLRAQLTSKHADVDRLLEDLSAMEQDVNALEFQQRADRQTLTQQAELATRQRDDAMHSLQISEQHLTEKLAHSESLVAELKSQLVQRDNELERLRRQISELEKSKNAEVQRIAVLDEKVLRLEHDKDSWMTQQVAPLREQLRQREDELVTERRLRADAERLQRYAEERQHRLEEDLKASNAERIKAIDELSELQRQNEVQRQGGQQWSQQLVALRQQAQTARDELAEIKQRLEDAKSQTNASDAARRNAEFDRASVASQFDALQVRFHALEQQCMQHQAITAEAVSANTTHEQVTSELTQRLQKARAQLKVMRQQRVCSQHALVAPQLAHTFLDSLSLSFSLGCCTC